MKAIILKNNFLPKSFNSSINDFNFIFPKNRIHMENKIHNQNFELINDKNVENYSDISSEIHQILLGSLLGDMHLRKECKNPNIEEAHSINQREYRKRPEVKAKIREYNRKSREKQRKGGIN